MSAWRVSASQARRRDLGRTLSVVVILLLWIRITTAAGGPPPQSFAAACARCHPDQAASEPLTPMGKALAPLGGNPTLSSNPSLTIRKSGYTYFVETTKGQSTYRVTDGTHSITLPIRWSFGEGAQTWLLEYEGQFYESLVSYYPSVNDLEITTGDEALKPNTLEDAIGRKVEKNELNACFGCHATKAVSKGQLNLQTLEPGVQCEHCHAGLESHLISEAVFGGDIESAPPSLGELNSEGISKFCGQCHRTWELVVRSRWRGQSNVRFQPYRLANSKCFDGADHRISCLACHDPHRTINRNDAYYDAKCLACHIASVSKDLPPPAGAKACPVSKSNCVSCHMPKVPLPNGLMTFYDHQIRLVKPGAPYPN